MDTDRVVNHGAQLADIAGKGVSDEKLRQLARRRRLLLVEIVCRRRKKIVEEQRDIPFAFPQRRHMNAVGAQPIVKIAAKAPPGFPFDKITVGGDDNPRFQTFGAVAAKGEIFPLLKQP